MTNHSYTASKMFLTMLRPASAEANAPAHCGAELRAGYSPVASEISSAAARSGCDGIATVFDTESHTPFVSGSVLELNDNRAMFDVRAERGVIDAAVEAEAKKTAVEAAAAHQPAECAPDAADLRRHRVARTQPTGPRNEQQPAASALADAVRGTRADYQALEAVEDEDEGNSWDSAQAYNDYLRECDV